MSKTPPRGRTSSLLASVALVFALASGGVTQAADASDRSVALGVSMYDGRQMEALDSFTASIGRTPATWSIWSRWGVASMREFPATAAIAAKARGATPIIWWEPWGPNGHSDPTYARHANIIAGLHDAYIRQYARDARAFKSPIILRFAHEANGPHFSWGRTGFDNTAASYVEAWRHIHRIFREEAADNVRFLWSVAKQSCPGRCNPYTVWYPGDAYVDYVGFSSFNWGAQHDEWRSMLQGYRLVTELLSEISAKPIIVVESASNPEGGDKTAWIKEGYPAVHATLPAIVAIVYLNVDLRGSGHPDWRLTSPPAALDAYADVAAMPEFQGRLPSGS